MAILDRQSLNIRVSCMDGNLIMEVASGIIGGLSIFLFGMKHLSDGMQAVAGERLRKMISAVTDNRFLACGTGTLVTSIIQSSSITTVILVGMVNAGIMTLKQAIGVMLGADIGTTITAWIVAINILEYGLPMLGIAGLFYLFSKNERVRYTSMVVMGLGMVFFGLQLMTMGLEPLRHHEGFLAIFSRFQAQNLAGVLKCVLAGTLVTAIVQSSSATVAITITLARTGVIGFDSAVALVLGQNIGTTITAFLASLGTSTNAKRTAYAHMLTKTIGVLIMIPLLPSYLHLLRGILGDGLDIAKSIAFAHTLFNVFLVCLFLPLVGPLAKLLHVVAPSAPQKEIPRLTHLDMRMLDTPAFGIGQSEGEIVRMGEHVHKMMGCLRTILVEKRNEDLERKVFHREEVMDTVQKEIVEFLSRLLGGEVPQVVVIQAREHLRIADEYESISDYVAAILKLHLKMCNANLEPTSEGRTELLDLHDQVAEYLVMIDKAVHDRNPHILTNAVSHGDAITFKMKGYRQTHLMRVERQHVSPLCSLIFTDMLTSYRRIKDHALTIAEVIAEEKK